MKLTFKNKPSYSEEGQPNPIRWAILSGSPATGFTNETSWLKCKDFFNDYCVAYSGGPKFNIYGFDTSTMDVPPQGSEVYIAVKDTTDYFDINMEVLNTWLVKQGLPEVSVAVLDTGEYVLRFDPYYFKSTYNISLISLIIRLCNIEYFFKEFEETFTYTLFPQKDQQKWDVVVKKGVFFSLPEGLSKYVWYCGPQYNSEVKDIPTYNLPSYVHNCGVLTYGKYF